MKSYSVENISVPSSNGKNDLQGVVYVPEGTPVGILQISHGMCEYIGRYSRFMEYMAERGYIVCGHDHLGHGSTSPQADYGYFGSSDGYKYLVNDLHRITEYMKKIYGDLPYFLLGHSMGSFIARLYLSKYSHELKGAVICGTGGPDPKSKIGILMASLVGFFRGEKHRSKLLDTMGFGSFNKKFAPARTSKDWLTRDNSIVDKYLQDPKCMFIFTASGFRDLSKLSSLSNSKAWYSSLNKDLPLLLISGDMDPVGNYGSGVRKVYDRLKEAGVKNADIKLYKDCRHELLNEINYKEIYSDTAEWMDSVRG